MTGHDRLRSLADDLNLIESENDLRALSDHLQTCAECASAVSRALEFRRRVAGPLKSRWHHVPVARIQSLKDAGSLPVPGSNGMTPEEWHVLVCPDCNARYLNVGERHRRATRSLRAVAAALTVTLLAGAGWWAFDRNTRDSGQVTRSFQTLELLAPDDGTRLSAWQRFEWTGLGRDRRYTLAVVPRRAGAAPVFTRPTSQPVYILTPSDLSLLDAAVEYEWYVTAIFSDGAAERTITSGRRRVRVLPQASATPTGLGLADKTAIEAELRNDETDLAGLEQRLTRMLPAANAELDRAWLLKTLGDVHLSARNRQQALPFYSAALELAEQVTGDEGEFLVARILGNSARCLQEMGKLAEAQWRYATALLILSGRPRDEAVLRSTSATAVNAGTLYRELGSPILARKAYEQALDADRVLQDRGAIADELTNLGNLRADEFEAPAEAIPLLVEADRIQQEIAAGGYPQRTLVDTVHSLATAYYLNRQPAPALQHLNRAAAIARRGKDGDVLLDAENSIGSVHLDLLRDPRRALLHFEAARPHIVESSNPDSVWATYSGLARTHLQLQDVRSARAFVDLAMATVERMRTSVGQYDRHRFGGRRSIPFYDAALVAISLGDIDGLFAAAERSRSAHQPAQERGTASTLEAFRAAMDDGEVALTYFSGSLFDPVVLLLVTKNAAHWWLLEARQPLERLARQASASIDARGSREVVDELLDQLSTGLLPAPAVTVLEREARRIIITADGVLATVPFEALRISSSGARRTVLELAEVSLVPSLSWWRNQKQLPARHTHPKDILAVTNPLVSSDCRSRLTLSAGRTDPLPDLPLSEREGRAILRDGGTDSLLLSGGDATSEAFRRRFSEFKILHFATHAVATEILATSFVMLSCQSTPDVLTGEDLTRLELTGQLVVLSACSTASGPALGAEGVDSLAYAALRAGAGAVVATRWPVTEGAALDTMRAFYRALGRGATVGEALRGAQLELAHLGRPVRDWVAFTTIGSSDLRPSIRPDWARRIENRLPIGATLAAAVAAIVVVLALALRRLMAR